jgi:serine/threonine-protein kinase
MPVVTAEKFVELVEKSQLADKDKIQSVLDIVRTENDGQLPTDVVALSKALQRHKLITRWHTEKLLQGKYKGFFLGKYKLLGHIGSGGMSSVYLAEHTRMNDLRAIKVLPPSKIGKSSYLARFQQEAKAIASLNHPNIVRAFDIDNDGDTHYIVMEYVQGSDLQNIVKKRGPLPYDQVADYIAQAAHGLQHAHEMGLIHRDVKPANLLLRKDGKVKLLDLGLAMFADESQSSLTIEHNDKVLGTADYLSPEQALNSHRVDHRADLYSLGCTMYYLLTGSPPFPSGSIAQRIAKHQKEMPQEVRKLRQDCPGELEGICWKLLQKDPIYRYTTAQQTAEVLEAWLANYRAVQSSAGTHARQLQEARGGNNALSQLNSKLSDPGSRSGDSSSFGSEFGMRSSGMGSALSDTLNNRGSDTLSDPSGSNITHLSAGDSGVLVKLASTSSSGSQIDLQAESRRPGGKAGNSSLHGSAATRQPASRQTTTGRSTAKPVTNSHARPATSTIPLPSQGGTRIVWITGLVIMFILAILLGVVIARLCDQEAPTSLPAPLESSSP